MSASVLNTHIQPELTECLPPARQMGASLVELEFCPPQDIAGRSLKAPPGQRVHHTCWGVSVVLGVTAGKPVSVLFSIPSRKGRSPIKRQVLLLKNVSQNGASFQLLKLSTPGEKLPARLFSESQGWCLSHTRSIAPAAAAARGPSGPCRSSAFSPLSAPWGHS